MSSKKFAVFDIDGTIFRSGWYREIIFELFANGKMPDSLSEAMTIYDTSWKTRKTPDAFELFEHKLVEIFVRELPNIRYEDFDGAVNTVFSKYNEHVYAYTRNLVETLKQDGYFLIAISGSQAEVVEPFANKYGFDEWVGQVHERGENGYFTGKTSTTYKGKEKILEKIVEKHNLTYKDSVAVGDSRGDISMLAVVDNPIAFNPTAELYEHAKTVGWKIVVERKNVTYELTHNGTSYILA